MSNASAKNVNAPADIKKKSQFVEVWKRLCRNKTAVLGLVIVALLTLMAILSPILIDYETQVIKTNYSEALQAPSADHWFGTDEMGRDILLRVMYGSTVSLSIGVVTVAVSLTVGLILGAAITALAAMALFSYREYQRETAAEIEKLSKRLNETQAMINQTEMERRIHGNNH